MRAMRFYILFLLLLVFATGRSQQTIPLVQIELLGVDISCAGRNDGAIRIALISGQGPVNYQWAGNGLTGSGQLINTDPIDIINNIPQGSYTFTVTDPAGVISTLQTAISDPPPLQGSVLIASNYKGYGVSCTGAQDGKISAGISGGTAPYYYKWSTGDITPTIDSLGVGVYGLTVTDVNNCSYTVSGNISAPPPIKSTIKTSGDRCYGQNQGFVEISNISGGVPPYRVSFDGSAPVSKFYFDQLTPGTYFFSIVDENQCEKDEAAILPIGVIFTLDIGLDSSMYTGDTLLYHLMVNRPLASVQWEPASSVLALDLENVLLFPPYTTEFKVTATDTIGCEVADFLNIRVFRKRDIYAPNVIDFNSLNTDNQYFTLYASGGVAEIASMRIYDRFHRLWFDKKNIPAGVPAEGWDGTHEGRIAFPGVYVWVAELRYTDGRKELRQGDLTVLR